jgi:hypothetical protein
MVENGQYWVNIIAVFTVKFILGNLYGKIPPVSKPGGSSDDVVSAWRIVVILHILIEPDRIPSGKLT